MGFLDTLKSLVGMEVDLSGVKNISLTRDVNNNKLFSFDSSKIDNSRTIIFNVGSDVLNDPQKREALQSLVVSQVREEEQPVMLESVSQTAHLVRGESESIEEALNFYQGKIPDTDIPILRASLFLRSQHQLGKSVDTYKHDIANEYGKRGSNIANLCTAGYFENYIRPMYEELEKRPNFTRANFIESYNQIVDDAPFAIFVSRQHSTPELISEIGDKIIRNKGYGIHRLNIHAIGEENRKKIFEAIEDSAVVAHFASEPEITIHGKVANFILFY